MKLVDDDFASIGMFGSNESFGVIETESFLYEENSPYILRRLVLSLLVRCLSQGPAIRRRQPLYPGARRAWVSRAGRR